MPHNFVTFAKEEITVSTTVKTLNATVYAPGTSAPASRARLQVLDEPIRYWRTGDSPTATTGKILAAGESITIYTISDLGNFKAIRDTSAVGDAALKVEYQRPG